MPCEDFKAHKQLAEENPKGLETLKNPQNWSNNPGFFGAGAPGGTAMSARSGALPSRGFTMPVHSGALPAHFGGMNRPVANPVIGKTSPIGQAPGSTDSFMEGNPLGVTSGFGA